MKYRVLILKKAEQDLDAYFLWAARHAPKTAARWFARFEKEILSLSNQPTRCEIAVESKKTSREIRQLLFGRCPNVFRVLFTIEGREVRVLRVRRASRRFRGGKSTRRAVRQGLNNSASALDSLPNGSRGTSRWCERGLREVLFLAATGGAFSPG